jgi:hypothetical protein
MRGLSASYTGQLAGNSNLAVGRLVQEVIALVGHRNVHARTAVGTLLLAAHLLPDGGGAVAIGAHVFGVFFKVLRLITVVHNSFYLDSL